MEFFHKKAEVISWQKGTKSQYSRKRTVSYHPCIRYVIRFPNHYIIASCSPVYTYYRRLVHKAQHKALLPIYNVIQFKCCNFYFTRFFLCKSLSVTILLFSRYIYITMYQLGIGGINSTLLILCRTRDTYKPPKRPSS